MNQRQRKILIVCGVLIAAMLVYPPFRIGGIGMGYHWVFSFEYGRVNVEQLLAQWVGVILIGGIAYLLSNANSGKSMQLENDTQPATDFSMAASTTKLPMLEKTRWYEKTGYKIGLTVLSFGVYFNLIMFAMAKIPPLKGYEAFDTAAWTGIVFYALWKQRGWRGWLGGLLGFLVGFFLVFLAAFISRFNK